MESIELMEGTTEQANKPENPGGHLRVGTETNNLMLYQPTDANCETSDQQQSSSGEFSARPRGSTSSNELEMNTTTNSNVAKTQNGKITSGENGNQLVGDGGSEKTMPREENNKVRNATDTIPTQTNDQRPMREWYRPDWQ